MQCDAYLQTPSPCIESHSKKVNQPALPGLLFISCAAVALKGPSEDWSLTVLCSVHAQQDSLCPKKPTIYSDIALG